MLKKFLALVLAGAMVIGSALPALAVGPGTIEDGDPVVTGEVKTRSDNSAETRLVVDGVITDNLGSRVKIGGAYDTYEADDSNWKIDPDSLNEEIEVEVTVDANGGHFLDENGEITNTTTITKTGIKVPWDVTFVNLGYVRDIPNLVGEDANHAFKFWSNSNAANATENLNANISYENGKYVAKFYAAWGEAPTNNKILDETISVGGLEDGDKTTFYQVLELNPDATETGGWVPAPGFGHMTYDATNKQWINDDGVTNGLTFDEIRVMLNIPYTEAEHEADNNKEVGKLPNVDTDKDGQPDTAGISAELASKIANLAETNGSLTGVTKYADIAADTNGVSTVQKAVDNDGKQTQPEAGLYVAIVTPGQTEYVYNPVFVGADYVGNTSDNWAVDLNISYSPKSIAKKSSIPLNKTAEKKDENEETSNEDGRAETVAVGDTIDFTVETTIPKFADNYDQAVFYLTDTLSEGLELVDDSIKVSKKVNNNWVEIGKDETFTAVRKKADGSTVTGIKYYDLNTNPETPYDYKITFTTDYLLYGISVPQDIKVEYQAKVTTDAPKSINLENNTVDLFFSNSPDDNVGKGHRRDETKHYTFDLDANILGPTEGPGYYTQDGEPWTTTEVVKVGIDRYGNEITQTKTLHGSQAGEKIVVPGKEQEIGALQGAEFLLYTDEGCTKVYYNDIMKDDTTADNHDYKIVSDGTGRLTIQNWDAAQGKYVDETIPGIRGLDAGKYWLKETKAPDGYIKAQAPIQIEITAEYNDVEYTDNNNTPSDVTDDVTWTVKELKSYTVKVGGNTTGTYTITNSQSKLGISPSATSNLGDQVTGGYGLIKSNDKANVSASHGKIQNVQGVELPSTGGIGTTIFYMGGAVLVLLAGVLLVSKRRMA